MMATEPGRPSSASHADAGERLHDWRDLVISAFAEDEVALREHLTTLVEHNRVLQESHVDLVCDLDAYRLALHVSVGLLAKATYQRDRALCSLYERRDEQRARDGSRRDHR